MAGTKTLHRLEKKFSFLQQKQEETMAKIRQEMKRTKKEIEVKADSVNLYHEEGDFGVC